MPDFFIYFLFIFGLFHIFLLQFYMSKGQMNPDNTTTARDEGVAVDGVASQGGKKKRERMKKPEAGKAPKEQAGGHIFLPGEHTHIRGETMVSAAELKYRTFEVRLLHQHMLKTETERAAECYTVKVKEGYHFVEHYPTDKIYLYFEEVNNNIFHNCHVYPLFVRFWSLYEASQTILKKSNVAILDPYHMHCEQCWSQI